ncbi:MAG: D-aminoacyl-tRNA deacylase [Gammaproteobacteria bacterium]
MIGLLQRVSRASVEVDDKPVAVIARGLVVFVGIERGDTETQANRLLERLLAYRVFPDEDGRMHRDLREIRGGLLLVPQFTLPADTRKGNRPSFTPAASPDEGKRLFKYLCAQAGKLYPETCQGVFGADMQVALVNDGPVTFWLQVSPDPEA